MGMARGSACRDVTQGSGHSCHLGLSTLRHHSGQVPLAMLGSGPAPGGLCLLSELVLTLRLCQVFGLVCMALSGFPLPLLAVCSLPWEKTPSQICPLQELLLCFNSFLAGGHGSLLAT